MSRFQNFEIIPTEIGSEGRLKANQTGIPPVFLASGMVGVVKIPHRFYPYPCTKSVPK